MHKASPCPSPSQLTSHPESEPLHKPLHNPLHNPLHKPLHNKWPLLNWPSLLGAACLGLLFGSFSASSHAATIVVNNTTCNLIPAFQAATTNSSVTGCASGDAGVTDTIVLPANHVYEFDSDFFANYYSGNTLFDIITDNVVVEGNGSRIIRTEPASGPSPRFRFFFVDNSGNLTLNDLHLEHGLLTAAGLSGGSIYTRGKLTTNRSSIQHSDTTNSGSAIYVGAGATTTVLNSTQFSFNGTNSQAVYLSAGNVKINDSFFSLNNVSPNGGAIINIGTADTTIHRSSFLYNSSSVTGGAIRNSADIKIYDSTFAHNSSSSSGGAIAAQGGSMSLLNNTFSENSATNKGGAIYHSSGSLYLANNLVAGNTLAALSGPGQEMTTEGVGTLISLNNWFGQSSNTTAEALAGFSPTALEFMGTSDGSHSLALSSLIKPLAAQTGAAAKWYYPLTDDSPAAEKGIDKLFLLLGFVDGCQSVDSASGVYQYRTDQLRMNRPEAYKCDIGAVERPDTILYTLPLPGNRMVVFPL